jgi:putative transport protein
VLNDQIFDTKISHIKELLEREFVASRILHDNGEQSQTVYGNTSVHKGDKVLIISNPKDKDAITALLGKEIDVDWDKCGDELVSRRIIVTRQDINGKMLRQLKIRTNFGANVTRVNRSGVDLVATPNLKLQMGDKLTVVGSEIAISHTEKILGNQMRRLNFPNLIPIFFGIALGCILANIPFFIPGIPEPLKLGLTGGPLIVAILIGYFGPKYNLVTYNTISANLMIREIGICIFLACVGLGCGNDFINTVFNENGLRWLLYGAIITIIPIIAGGLIGRFGFHLNYYTLLGVLSGANTNPPALNYSNELTSTDTPSVGYSTVYPFAMFLRIITIQILIIVFA